MALHPVLERQLRKSGIALDADSDDGEALRLLLGLVDRAYHEADQDRYTLERSLEISSREMRELHERLAQERDQLSLILDTFAAGVVFICESRTITYCNPRAALQLGIAAEAVVGRSATALLFGESTPEAVRFERFLESGDAHLEVERGRFQRQGSTTFPADYRIERAEGDLASVGYVLFFRDVTEEQQTANELRRVQVESGAAQQAALQKAEFLANMSHEIRTPMTAILGYADLMGQPGTNAVEMLEYHGIIQRNGQHLLALINDILDLSKIEAGKLVVEKIPCSVAEVTADIYSLSRQRALGRGLEFRLEYQGVVPQEIETDPTRLRQVLVNLVGNAIKFTEQGSVTIVVEGDPETRSVLFSVTDTGIGMSEEQCAHVFNAFAQADNSTTRRFGGTGLGLAISQRLAQMLGGEIALDSTLGEGSTFSFGLDLSDQPTVDWSKSDTLCEVPGNVERAKDPEKPQLLAGRKILYAEDGPDNQRLIRHFLTIAGAEVTIAENGKQAYEAALHAETSDRPYDCILMDMQMPILDGYEATEQLRDVGYRRPIIALTAHALKGDGEKCINAGCDLYLTKPIDRRKIVERLATVLSEHELTF